MVLAMWFQPKKFKQTKQQIDKQTNKLGKLEPSTQEKKMTIKNHIHFF